MMIVYVARQRFDAWLVADRLNQIGVRAHVFNQHASSIVGDVPADVAQPQVWIERECDRDRAWRLIAEIERSGRAEADLACAACGELSPDSFDLCWNCGGAL